MPKYDFKSLHWNISKDNLVKYLDLLKRFCLAAKVTLLDFICENALSYTQGSMMNDEVKGSHSKSSSSLCAWTDPHENTFFLVGHSLQKEDTRLDPSLDSHCCVENKIWT